MDQTTHDKLLERYRALRLPDVEAEEEVEGLWELTWKESRQPCLSQHVDFVESLDTSEHRRIADRLLGDASRLIVSTIHKVKGLEFECVLLKASPASFPLGENGARGARLADLCAEEMRLYYVGMTRARDGLFTQWGQREEAWLNERSYEGATGSRMLQGTPHEVHLSWPGYSPQFRRGLQQYIRAHVRVGDKLRVSGGGQLVHGRNGLPIARLKEGLHGTPYSTVRVSAVYRYPIGEVLRETYPRVWDSIHPELKAQGWLHTVLVTGRL